VQNVAALHALHGDTARCARQLPTICHYPMAIVPVFFPPSGITSKVMQLISSAKLVGFDPSLQLGYSATSFSHHQLTKVFFLLLLHID
jgi:hypothetical protein